MVRVHEDHLAQALSRSLKDVASCLACVDLLRLVAGVYFMKWRPHGDEQCQDSGQICVAFALVTDVLVKQQKHLQSSDGVTRVEGHELTRSEEMPVQP